MNSEDDKVFGSMDEYRTWYYPNQVASMAKEGYQWTKQANILDEALQEALELVEDVDPKKTEKENNELAKQIGLIEPRHLEIVSTWRTSCPVVQNSTRCGVPPEFVIPETITVRTKEDNLNNWSDQLVGFRLCDVHARDLYLDGQVELWVDDIVFVAVLPENRP